MGIPLLAFCAGELLQPPLRHQFGEGRFEQFKFLCQSRGNSNVAGPGAPHRDDTTNTTMRRTIRVHIT